MPGAGHDERSRRELKERLQARGKRLTTQRERVLDAVARRGHATPDEVAAEVHGDGGPELPASTIYRALEALQELGLVTHTHVDHRVPSYHLTAHVTHLHVACRRCGWVGEAPLSDGDALAAALLARLGFRAEVAHSAIHGLCAACAKEES